MDFSQDYVFLGIVDCCRWWKSRSFRIEEFIGGLKAGWKSRGKILFMLDRA